MGCSFRLEFEAMHLARLRWGTVARAKERRVQRLLAPRSGAELQERSEASGLEHGARGHKPHQFEAAGAGSLIERIIGK
jgi:hypothetical protein